MRQFNRAFCDRPPARPPQRPPRHQSETVAEEAAAALAAQIEALEPAEAALVMVELIASAMDLGENDEA